jgi:predicted ATPase/class 3 adenylate cyclase
MFRSRTPSAQRRRSAGRRALENLRAALENQVAVGGHRELPAGRVTFLFTDVEGSTRLLEEHPTAYGAGIARHHELLEEAVEGAGGVVFETIGDAVYAAFDDPAAAVEAARKAQVALASEDWGALGEIRVRMGLHTGDVERRGAHYFGPALYRCARLMATAHGRQVVMSDATAEAVRASLGGGASLLDLGQHRLKDLAEPECVHQLLIPSLPSSFPPLRSAGGRPNNLPADVKTFVGRQEELERVRSLLLEDGARLVTLTGPAGSGKTRIALRAAEALLERFRDGVFFVPLAPLADGSLVTSAIAQVLGVPDPASGSRTDALITHLGGKELLLVLDNFEHVADAAPELSAVLAGAADVRALTTSRAPLRIQGEHELRIGPLPSPDEAASFTEAAQAPSVQLFAERAREIRGDFVLTTANASAVAELCRRLDGLPLAIELAAARTRLLSPEAMLERIDGRLRLLTGGGADLPSRQRTLRDAIAWSYNLLDERERTLFVRLSIFRGGCSLDAAEELFGGDEVIDSLTVLSEHSLVTTRWNELGEPRFDMLETLAEFARELLEERGEAEELARRHAAYFADFAEAAAPALYTDVRAPWLRRLADDRDNFRAMLAWCCERDEASYGLRALGALWLWYWASFAEGLDWAERVLALPSAAEPTPARAGALFTAAICSAGTGDFASLSRHSLEGIALSRALGEEAWLALTLALGGGHPEDADSVRRQNEESIEVGRRTGDPWVAAWTKMISGLCALLIGDVERARTWAAEGMDEFGELGDSWSRASASMTVAFSLVQLGDLEGARAALEGSVPALLQVGDLKMANGCLIAQAMIERFSGNDEEAAAAYGRALELCVEAGDAGNAPVCLEGMAATAAARDPARAARLLGVAQALFDAGNAPTVPVFEAFSETTYSRLEGELGHELAQQQLAAGRASVRNGFRLADAAAV